MYSMFESGFQSREFLCMAQRIRLHDQANFDFLQITWEGATISPPAANLPLDLEGLQLLRGAPRAFLGR